MKKCTGSERNIKFFVLFPAGSAVRDDDLAASYQLFGGQREVRN